MDFKYEKLPNFCFLCGIIGHTERYCHRMFEGATDETERLLGTWLKETGKRSPAGGSNPWLISDQPSTKSAQRTNGQVMGTESSGYPGNFRVVGGRSGAEDVGGKDKSNVSQKERNMGLGKNSLEVSGDGPVEVDQKRRRADLVVSIGLNDTEMTQANLMMGSKKGIWRVLDSRPANHNELLILEF